MDYKYIPFYVQGNAVTGMYYGQWGMAEDRDIEYVKEMCFFGSQAFLFSMERE